MPVPGTDIPTLAELAGSVLRKRMREIEELKAVLEQIRGLSNYPGKGRSTFADLAAARRKINKLACDALREES